MVIENVSFLANKEVRGDGISVESGCAGMIIGNVVAHAADMTNGNITTGNIVNVVINTAIWGSYALTLC